MRDQAGAAIWLLFDVAHLKCALRHDEVRKVVALPALDRPPASPAALAGVMNLAGSAVPVVRLDLLLGLPASPPVAYQCVIVLRRTDPPLALLADRATDVAAWAEDSALPVEQDKSYNGCVVAQARRDGATVHLLSAERLLEERERHALADFQAMQQRRLDELGVPL